jgi:hypothetical protein
MHILFFLVISSVPLCGMTPENTAVFIGRPLSGYDIENGIDKFKSVFPVMEKQFDERRAFRKKSLLEAVKEEFDKTGKFDASTLVFNPEHTACGWLQSFCARCFSPNQCDCRHKELVPGALYRAQFLDRDSCGTNNHNHKWQCLVQLLVYKACISSAIIEKIVQDNEHDKKRGAENHNWDGLNIPACKETWSKRARVSNIFFNATDECAVFEYAPRGTFTAIENYSIVRSITPHGEIKLRNLEFTLGNSAPCEATLILQSPDLLDRCAAWPNKGYTGEKVIVPMQEVLSTAYKFSASHIASINHIISDTVDTHEFLIAARCAQILGFHNKAEKLLASYNRVNKKELYPTLIKGDWNFNSYVLCCHPLGSMEVLAGPDTLLAERYYDINVSLQQLSEYTIDNIDKFDEARNNELKCFERNKYFVQRNNLLEIRSHQAGFVLDVLGYEGGGPFFVKTSWCKEILDLDKVAFFRHYPQYYINQNRPSTFALVLNSVLYIFKFTMTETTAEPPQKVPLLTEKEAKSGYVIKKIRSINPAHCMQLSLKLSLKPAHWWEHVLRPRKMVNIRDCSIDLTHQRKVSRLTIMSSLRALCHSILNACLQMFYYGF